MVEWFVGVMAIGVMVVLPWGVGYCVNYRELPMNKSSMNNWLTGAWVLCALIFSLAGPWILGTFLLALAEV